MDMVLVCFNYDIKPPGHLFGMAKAFVCLGGADTIYSQNVNGHDLLREQVVEFLIRELKLCEGCKSLVKALLSMDKDKAIHETANAITSILK